MGAIIELNGQRLGNASNQFLRYVFEVSPVLRSSGNVLNVTFGMELGVKTHGRYTKSAQTGPPPRRCLCFPPTLTASRRRYRPSPPPCTNLAAPTAARMHACMPQPMSALPGTVTVRRTARRLVAERHARRPGLGV